MADEDDHHATKILNQLATASRQARDADIALAGRLLYGDLWVGELTFEEWQLAQRYGGASDDQAKLFNEDQLPPDTDEAAKAARARQRFKMLDWQMGQVYAWLANLKVGTKPEGVVDRLHYARSYNKEEFAVWRATWPQAMAGAAARKNAVRFLWDLGDRPGDNVTWPEFCKKVNKRAPRSDGKDWDLETVKRDIAQIKKLLA